MAHILPIREAWAKTLKGIARAALLLAALLLAALLIAGTTAKPAQAQSPQAQLPQAQAPQGLDEAQRPRPRMLMKIANEQYKRGEYEAAADNYMQAQAGQSELNPTERRDLAAFLQQNETALKARREGALQLKAADDALRQGRTQDAAKLVKSVTANQYMSAQDRVALANLNEQLRTKGMALAKEDKMMAPLGVNRDVKSLLAAARTAMNKGQFDLADAYAKDAADVEKESSGIYSMIHMPWTDTSSKVRREIASARAKATPAMAKDGTTDKKDSSSFFSPVKNLFTTRSDTQVNPSSPSFPGSDNKTPSALASNSKPDMGKPDMGKPDISQTNMEKLVLTGSNTDKARTLVKESRKALDRGEVETARRYATMAKELHPNLEWREENPEKLLIEIQRRYGKDATTVAAKPAPTDPRAMVKEARALLQQEKFDDADKLCALAAANQSVRWGLFEDSPDKVRKDLQKQRSSRDREDAAKLMTEARKLYTQGNYQDSKRLAFQAQKLHGPYTIWDLGDRPQKLIEEIHKIEIKRGTPFDTEMAKDKDQSNLGGKYGQLAKNGSNSLNPSPTDMRQNPPVLIGTAAAQAKSKAVILLVEARELQKRGMLVEARAKAIEARQQGAVFGLNEDSPEMALVSMAALCDRQVQQLMQQAAEIAQNNPQDSSRFKNADLCLMQARKLAQAFGQDMRRIEETSLWLRQVAATSGVNPLVAFGSESKDNLVQANAIEAPASPSRRIGLEKLEKARLELRAGNTAIAMRIAQEVHTPAYGVQAEALQVIRSIEAEEHNQRILQANRTADAGFEAYARRDFRQASSILSGIDLNLLTTDKKRRVGEVMAQKEMQPDGVQQALGQTPEVNPKTGVVQAVKNDQTDDNLIARHKAMEEIQFQKLRERGIQAQNSAANLYKTGNKFKALETLKDYVDQVSGSELDSERMALLKQRAEKRIDQYRTMMATEDLDARQKAAFSQYNERSRTDKIRQTQEEVSDLLNQTRALMKENKFKEAYAQARKAQELDSDNTSAQLMVFQARTKLELDRNDKWKLENEDGFLKDLSPGMGQRPSIEQPMMFDIERQKIAAKRESGLGGYSSQTRNPIEREIERKLQQHYPINFRDTPLYQVLDDLANMTKINIVPNRRALQDESISLETPVTLSVEGISLKYGLTLLLRDARLTFVIRNEVLEVTTERDSQGRRKQVVYPVADLVVPIENHPTPAVNDFNQALARHISSMGGVVTQAPSPVQGPTALPNGQTVSGSYSQGGLGSAFASTPAMQNSPAGGAAMRIPGATIEDLLINLITNSVASTTWSNVGGEGTIQYFPLGMALVINQTQEVQEDVKALLDSLRKLQDLEVAIEMRLVSVSESFFERMGVDFDVNFRTGTSRREVDLLGSNFTPFNFVNRNNDRLNLVSGLTPAGTLTPDLNIPLRNSSFDFSVPPFGGYPGTLGADGGLSLGLAFLSDIQVFMFLDAAQGDRRTNVMQAPKITVFNGQTATMTVNDQQFFLTGVQVVQANAQLFFAPQNQPFPLGVTMTVTPVVSGDRRFVRVNMTPTLTNLASTTVPLIPLQVPVPQLFEGPGAGVTTVGQPVIFQMFFQQPTFTTISVNTTVNIPDGGTVLLGGLKTLNESRNEFGPPLLSKIPYLSRLFKNVGYGRDGQSLMIMVTPRIIINAEEEAVFTGEVAPIPRP